MMIRRATVLALAVGLLVSGLLGNALADNVTRWNGPGPRPWQMGDPDWPAYTKVNDSGQFHAGDLAGQAWITPDGSAARRTNPLPEASLLDQRRSLSRQYEIRILGRTIRIRR
jgi:hypothetical protein